MNIIGQYPEIRTYKDGRVEAIRFVLDGGITDVEIEQLKQEHEGYSGVLEHYLTLFAPPVDIEEVVAEKDGIISALGQTLRVVADELPDEQASKFPNLYHEMKYDGSLIKAGTRINWQGQLKRASVDLWDREDQNPSQAPTLWVDLNYFQGRRIIPEVITATLAFSKGEVGYWPADQKFYKAKRDGVVHTPAQYMADWEEVTE